MLMRVLMILAVLAPLAFPVLPAAAQRSERVLTIFGDDSCPADTICVRAPERDRYRIPKELRPRSSDPENTSWAVRAQAMDAGARTGVGSCSAVGAGGWTGCWTQQMRAAKAEQRQQAEDDRNVP